MIGRFNAAHELLRENLDQRGHRVAVFYDESSLTFLELARSAKRFGNLLLGLDVRPRQRVVIQLPDAPECLCAFLGCIQAGLWPVLISPDLGPDARDFILRDVQAAAWVTHQAQANTETRGAPVRPRLNMDGVDCQAALADAAADLDPHLAHGDDIAFLLYSSGSTGHPKGVPHRHRDMLFCADTYGAKILGITTDQDRHFSASKLFFAYGLEFTSRGRCREPTRARSSVFACAKSPHPILRMPCSGRGPRVATTRKQPNQTML